MTRFLLILALALHPLAVVGGLGACAAEQVAPRSVETCCCGPLSCCAVEATPSCGCEIDSAPRPAREQPATPRAMDAPVVLLALVLTTVNLQPARRQAPTSTARAARPHCTHNQRQSLLCTWRT